MKRWGACGEGVMAASPIAVAPPDSTEDTFALLRELRRGRARKQAANIVYWLYLAALVVLIYGGWLVAAIVRALQHPPAPTPETPMLLRTAPAGLAALALLLVLSLLWDARWRGPVILARPAADWLLDTPVSRDRLLRPRYRMSVLTWLLAGACLGLVPTALLLAAGLGGGGIGHTLRLAGAAMLSTALLAGLGTGIAALTQAHSTSARLVRLAPAAALAAAVLAIIAVVTAATGLTSVVGTVVLWSGPWGWAAQGPVALAGRSAPLWPLADGLLALAAVAAIVAGDRAAAQVPAAELRARARTLGEMSAAVLNMDARRVTTAYRGATGSYLRARFRIRAPRSRQLALPWRDLTALIRVPSRLAWSALLALSAVGLGVLAVRAPHAALLPITAALAFGYLAAAGLCEGARLDGDDPRRSGQLPFSYDNLVLWHAIVPCLVLAVLAGIPAAVLAALTGHAPLIAVVAVTIPVLVGGALVNTYRGQLEAEMFGGFDTAVGHSSSVTITLWYITGPMLAIAPMIAVYYAVLEAHTGRRAVFAFVLSAALAAWLVGIARSRARRLKST
jgi:Family of unknown function (DUF6297)